ncbi:MAG: LEA type 2 family protein [Halosimplex sp.]
MTDGDSPDESDESDDGFEWRWPAAAALLVLAALVALYLLGALSAPSVRVVDRGDWGEVTDERTEVVTTLRVRNPNPVGATLGPGFGVDYEIAFNGVTVATGERSSVPVPAGNTTVRLHSRFRNDRVPAWWVAYVRANETLRVDVDATLRARVGPTPAVSHTFERDRTMLDDARPVRDALSKAVDRSSGRYTRTVELSDHAPTLLRAVGIDDRSVTVGYEVERGWATWGAVTENRTRLLLHLRVRNPGDVPVPATPAGLRAEVAANGVTLFERDADALSARNLSARSVLRPGEARTLTVAATMPNDRLDEWFTSHVRRGERSNVTARVRLLAEVPLTDETVRFPTDGPATERCSFRTAILVDDQTAGADCGADGHDRAGRRSGHSSAAAATGGFTRSIPRRRAPARTPVASTAGRPTSGTRPSRRRRSGRPPST